MSAFAASSVRDREIRGGGGGREGGPPALAIQAVQPVSVAGGVCLGVVEFGMFRGIKPKIKKEIERNLDGPPKGAT